MSYVEDSIELKDVYVGRGAWRNFSGEKREANKNGERRFTIFLPVEVWEELNEAGWYVKHNEKYAGRNSEYTMDIALRYDFFPPVITLKTADGEKMTLNEETVGLLDSTDIAECDLVIRPHNWDVNGRTGVKAYVKEMTVTAQRPRRSIRASMGLTDED